MVELRINIKDFPCPVGNVTSYVISFCSLFMAI